MGAWGYQLTANDSACDLIGDLADVQVEFLKKLFSKKSQDSFSRLGVLSSALEKDTKLRWNVLYSLKETKVLDIALTDIDFLLTCKEWIDGWNEPNKVKAELRKFKRKLLKLQKENEEN